MPITLTEFGLIAGSTEPPPDPGAYGPGADSLGVLLAAAAGMVDVMGAGADSFGILAGAAAGTFTAGGMSTVFFDTFTVSSDTPVVSHTPDTGTSWTLAIDTTAAAATLNCIATTDDLKASANVNSAKMGLIASPAPSSADCDVTIVLSSGGPAGGDDPIFLLARWQDSSNFYALCLYQSARTGDDFFIYKVVAGTVTLIGTCTAPFDETATNTIKFELRGTALKGYKDGSLLVSATDSSITAAGACGIGYGNIVSALDDVGTAWRITSFKVEA